VGAIFIWHGRINTELGTHVAVTDPHVLMAASAGHHDDVLFLVMDFALALSLALAAPGQQDWLDDLMSHCASEIE
jgi:hypothetical protein